MGTAIQQMLWLRSALAIDGHHQCGMTFNDEISKPIGQKLDCSL
jgi:hypothetical protein